jgi:SRSO17 transposase
VTSDGRRYGGWLLGERTTRGQAEARQYFGSHRPAAATLEELAGDAQRRYAVAQVHEQAQGELGWDHDQGRLWPGFHRHAVTVRLAYRVLVWLERRPRRSPRGRGRPHEPFSPRPDRRRCALPAIHRDVAQWRRHQAVPWWVTTERFIELCSRRF